LINNSKNPCYHFTESYRKSIAGEFTLGASELSIKTFNRERGKNDLKEKNYD